MASAAGTNKSLQDLSDEFQDIQKSMASSPHDLQASPRQLKANSYHLGLQEIIEARQRLDAQLSENKAVKKVTTALHNRSPPNLARTYRSNLFYRSSRPWIPMPTYTNSLVQP